MNTLGFQSGKHSNWSDPGKPDLPTNPNGGDGWKERDKMEKSKPVSPSEFVTRFNEFLTAVHKYDRVRDTLKEPHLVDLFRLWWMDFREQEAVEEAREQERNFGLGDMLD
jgi:hypothetical protein